MAGAQLFTGTSHRLSPGSAGSGMEDCLAGDASLSESKSFVLQHHVRGLAPYLSQNLEVARMECNFGVRSILSFEACRARHSSALAFMQASQAEVMERNEENVIEEAALLIVDLNNLERRGLDTVDLRCRKRELQMALAEMGLTDEWPLLGVPRRPADRLAA